MKKGMKMFVAMIIAMLVLTGCERESVVCGMCMKDVVGISYKVTAFGDETRICGTCHAEINEAFDKAIEEALEMYEIYESLVD